MKVYWKTQDGRVLDVDDMSDTHVRNAFKMLLRNQAIRQANEVKRRHEARVFNLNGDMANVFNQDQEDYEYAVDCGVEDYPTFLHH